VSHQAEAKGSSRVGQSQGRPLSEIETAKDERPELIRVP
jgi:hypothetical protein